jgi:hypothetical protein
VREERGRTAREERERRERERERERWRIKCRIYVESYANLCAKYSFSVTICPRVYLTDSHFLYLSLSLAACTKLISRKHRGRVCILNRPYV